jgi:hypothetical protein
MLKKSWREVEIKHAEIHVRKSIRTNEERDELVDVQ